MMNFRTITAALIDLLGTYSGSEFRVLGYRGQSSAATEVKDTDRSVGVFFTDGDFPKGSGRWTGPIRHEPSWQIELTASAAAQVDLSVLSDSESTAAERAAALSSAQEATYEADESLNELLELVYQILMDGKYIDLELGKGVMSSRWVSSMTKNVPVERGSLVTITGMINYSCVTSEEITGAILTEADPDGFIDITVDIDGDDVEQTGVSV